MQTQKSSLFLEPVRCVVRSADMAKAGSSRLIGGRMIRYVPRSNRRYFFNRVIENEDDFEAINIMADVSHAARERARDLVGRLKGKLEAIVTLPEVVEQLMPSDLAQETVDRMIVDVPEVEFPPYYFYKHNSSIVIPTATPNVFFIISKTKEEADQLTQFIKLEFEKLNSVTKDFGLQLVEFLIGRSFQENVLRASSRIVSIGLKEPKDEFEKEIIATCESLTNSYLPNVEITFKEPAEIFEYDIFIGYNDETKLIVEPTNYETVKDQMHSGEMSRDTLKSKVILATQDKALGLGARSIVIAKGFPDDVFGELKKIADSRKVVLLNEQNYKVELSKILLSCALQGCIPGRPLYY